jgi:probable addiction module antidote protein
MTMPVEFEPFGISEYMDSEERIAGVLAAAAEDDDPNVLLGALMHAAKARGMIDVANAAGPNRESLYKALRPGAHPRFETVQAVLRALGVKLTVSARATGSVEVVVGDMSQMKTPAIPGAYAVTVSEVSEAQRQAIVNVLGKGVVVEEGLQDGDSGEAVRQKTSGEPGGARKRGRKGGATHLA